MFHMDREECVESLEAHANVKPAVTRIGKENLYEIPGIIHVGVGCVWSDRLWLGMNVHKCGK
jgi:hypothetical protein